MHSIDVARGPVVALHSIDVAYRPVGALHSIDWNRTMSGHLRVLFISRVKAVGDLALFPVHVISWYDDCFGDVDWHMYRTEDGELWWYQDLIERASIVQSKSDWTVYQSEEGGRWWAHHWPSKYWTFL